jgi:putative ABC transport system substrate-binding protein
VQVTTIPVTDGVRAAIESLATEPNGGRILSPAVQRKLIRLAEQYRLPTITGFRTYAVDGALMSYDSDVSQNVCEAASYVDHILSGTKVGELPVHYATTFRLAVNLRAAKAIGLTTRASFLLLAHEVIE